MYYQAIGKIIFETSRIGDFPTKILQAYVD